MELVADLHWLNAALLFFQTTTFVQLLGFLEEFVEIKLPDNVLLGMKNSMLGYLCGCDGSCSTG